jgi:glyoxylase-like metal-dependent hydrolase (beta-lactamase superfamily II)
VYGEEEMRRSYGELVNVPADRARASHDEMVLDLAGRPLRLIDTPGHAKHHHCIWDARSRGWFTGDTFGLSYRELDIAGQAWALPTSTPVQFEPEAMKASIARMLATEPECLYLTHFGRVREVGRLAELLCGLIDGMVKVARQAQAERHERIKQGLRDLYSQSLSAHGSSLSPERMAELLALDLELNAQGLEVWLGK